MPQKKIADSYAALHVKRSRWDFRNENIPFSSHVNQISYKIFYEPTREWQLREMLERKTLNYIYTNIIAYGQQKNHPRQTDESDFL